MKWKTQNSFSKCWSWWRNILCEAMMLSQASKFQTWALKSPSSWEHLTWNFQIKLRFEGFSDSGRHLLSIHLGMRCLLRIDILCIFLCRCSGGSRSLHWCCFSSWCKVSSIPLLSILLNWFGLHSSSLLIGTWLFSTISFARYCF